jgi:hypothetical protein
MNYWGVDVCLCIYTCFIGVLLCVHACLCISLCTISVFCVHMHAYAYTYALLACLRVSGHHACTIWLLASAYAYTHALTACFIRVYVCPCIDLHPPSLCVYAYTCTK